MPELKTFRYFRQSGLVRPQKQSEQECVHLYSSLANWFPTHLPSTGNDPPLTARLAAALLMTFHVQLTTEQLVS